MESREHRIRVPRTARYRVMGDPVGAAEVWFVLHGYRQLAERFIGRFEALPGVGAGRRAVVAPEALSRFYVEDAADVGPHGPESRVGATWMTRADREHEIRDYVEYLDRLADAVLDREPGGPAVGPAEVGPLQAGPIEGGDRRLVVLGFSQGAATASRWVTYGRVRPAELVLWAGGLAADLDMTQAAESLKDVAVRVVRGRDDEWATTRAEDTRERLAAVGLSAHAIDFDGGHEIRADTLTAHWAD